MRADYAAVRNAATRGQVQVNFPPKDLALLDRAAQMLAQTTTGADLKEI
jgi:hypothetical protein